MARAVLAVQGKKERGLAVDEFEAENVMKSDFGCLTNPCVIFQSEEIF